MLDKEPNLRALRQGGSPEEREYALADLSNTVVSVPIRRAKSVAGHPGEKKVSLLIESNGGRREVAVFTDEDVFLDWASGKDLQSFSVAAGDLALTLPPDAWLVVNPRTQDELRLSPDEVQILAYPPIPSEPAGHLSAETVKDVSPPEETPADDVNRFDVSGSASHQQEDFAGVGDDAFLDSTAEELSETERKTMKEELKKLFSRFDHIDEAYFVETGGAHSAPLLGLLGGACSSEERFSLIEGVAEISRKYFSEAGALEVYDDLHSPSSRSWELFNTQAPFFSRVSEEGTHSYADQLVRRDYDAEPNDERASGKKRSLWQRLRNKYNDE